MALNYLTIDQITERLSKKTAETLSGETVGTTAYDAWITSRGEEIEGQADGLVGRRYRTPIDLSADANAAALFRGKLLDWLYAEVRGLRFKVAKQDAERRDRAMAYFREVGDGKVALPMGAEPAAATVPATQGEVSGPARQFTRDDMAGL